MWVTSLLTICNRLFVNKMSQAMRTHPDIDLLQEVNRLVAMQLACFGCVLNASTISYISECDLMNLLSPLGPTMRRMTMLRLLMMILTKCIIRSKYVMLCKIYSRLYIRNLTINKSMQFYDLSYLYFAQDNTDQRNATQRNTIHHNTTHHNTTQQITSHHNTTQKQHNTSQHNKSHHITTNHIRSHAFLHVCLFE